MILIFYPASASYWPEINPNRYASPSQDQEWMPDAEVLDPAPIPIGDLPGVPPDIKPSAMRLALAQLVDIALRNNPTTRQTWAEARAIAASWGRAKSDYYPQLDGEVDGAGGRVPRMTGGSSYADTNLTLSYLLLDFGRGARAKSAKQALIAANWNHNQAIQDLLRDVPQAYYTHLTDKAQLIATKKSLADAMTTLQSTIERRKAGVSTISDVLKARANKDQVVVDLEGNKGDVEISRGKLATTVGWPANTRFEISETSGELPLGEIGRNVDSLIEIARKRRPDLNSSMASLRQKEADLLKAKRAPFPKLTGTGNIQWQGTRRFNDRGYYGGVQLQIPLFHGFDFENQIREAQGDLDAARAAFSAKEDNVIEDVWSAFYNFRTAIQQLKTSKSVLDSAQQSFDVSLGRYRAGVADIVELLDAQSTLASARAQVVDSRMKLYNSHADLIHSVGTSMPTDYWNINP